MNGLSVNQRINEPGSSLKVPSFSSGMNKALEGPILCFTRVPFHTQLAFTQEAWEG